MRMYSRQQILDNGYIPVDIDNQRAALEFIECSPLFRVQLLGLLEDISGVELFIHPERKLTATYKHNFDD